jgi:hypothetical protein
MSSRAQRNRPYVIRARDQIAALESAVRQEIIDVIQAAGPCSAAELAALMGRPPDALYYHIRKLQAVGLLVTVDTRRPNGREQAVYDLVGHPLALHFPAGRAAAEHPLHGVVRAMARTRERDSRTAHGTREARQDSPTRNLWVGRRHAWLTPADLRRVNALIDELVTTMTKARDPARGELCTLTLLLAPRRSRRGRRGAASAAKRE